MAPDDYEYDVHAQQDEEQRDEEQRGEERDRGEGSSSGYVSSNDPTIVVPGQSQMPSNNLRHITLDAQRVNNDYVSIHLTTHLQQGTGSWYDIAVLLTATTNDGIDFDSTGLFNQNTRAADYSSAATLLSSNDATQRTYDVTFASGIVRSLTLTIPGKKQSYEQDFNVTKRNYQWNGYTTGCNIPTGVNWSVNHSSNSDNLSVNSGSMYCQTWPIADPSSIYYSGDAAFDITSSQTLEFTHNTENRGSFINQDCDDWFLRK